MGNTNTPLKNSALEIALTNIPANFRDKITDTYLQARQAFHEGNYDTTSLRVGKFCESVLRFLQYELTNGNFTPFGTRIINFTAECRRLEQLPASAGSENLRLIMPRGLDFAYTVRNKRGVGHIGGDVDANQIDAACVMRIADWCLCELMRFYHAMSLEEAQALLDAISIRQAPSIWSIGGKKRILTAGIDEKDQILALLHSEPQTGVPIEDLKDWVEYAGRMSDFKRWHIMPLHKQRLIEFDKFTDIVILSPTGAKKVEDEILPKMSLRV